MSIMVGMMVGAGAQLRGSTGSSELPADPPEGQYNLSYDNPPFWSSVVSNIGNASPGLTAVQLFSELGTHFSNAGMMADVRAASLAVENEGRVPICGAQRWEDSWVQAMPTSAFTGEPAWVNANLRNHASFGTAYAAWGDWINTRPQYWDKNRSNLTPRTDWNSWGGHWGHISPNMPLDAGDIIAGMDGNTYGDWFAHKWGQTVNKTGAWGIQLSDFVDSHPHQLVSEHDFNERIIDRFETWSGENVPGATLADRATYIRANLVNEWVDFWNVSYGDFFMALAREFEQQGPTAHEGVIFNQDGDSPSARRMKAGDPRLIFTRIPPAQVISQADYRTMQSDRSGDPPSFMIASAGLWSSRVPQMRLASNLHTWDDSAGPTFQSGLDTHHSNLTGQDRTDFGMAWLKRLWFGTGWMHIARIDGTVRRGVAWFLRGYWDGGTVDANWMTQIRTVIPTKPFGFALYYSGALERGREVWWVTTGQTNETSLYLTAATVRTLIETDRVPMNYYVSDWALSNLQTAARPSAWIVLNRYHPVSGADLLPAAELAMLQASGTVLDTAAAAQAFNNPLAFSTNCVGFGFGDQNNRLIVVATNLTNATLNATVTVKTLPDGDYKATDLLSAAVINFSSSAGVASVPVSIPRWETRALAITTLAGGGVL